MTFYFNQATLAVSSNGMMSDGIISILSAVNSTVSELESHPFGAIVLLLILSIVFYNNRNRH